MNKAHSVLVVAFLCVVLAACKKNNTPAKPPVLSYGDVKPEILESEKVKYDLGFGLSVPDMVLYNNPDALAKCTFPGLHVDNFIEVHVEVLPIYAFGSGNTSGDYYAVSGYMVAHNASAFRMGTALKDSGWIESDEKKGAGDYVNYAAWFMSKMKIDFQLLAEDGSPVSNEKVNFFVTPEPSINRRTHLHKRFDIFSAACPHRWHGKKGDRRGISSLDRDFAGLRGCRSQLGQQQLAGAARPDIRDEHGPLQ